MNLLERLQCDVGLGAFGMWGEADGAEVVHMWGEADGAEVVQPGAKNAQRDLNNVCKYLMGVGLKEMEPDSSQCWPGNGQKAIRTNWNSINFI